MAIMACCLMAPSHHLNQYWLQIIDIHPSAVSKKMFKICWHGLSFEIKSFNSSPLVPHICISESGQHWFRLWLVAYSTHIHYLNQCWIIIKWTLRNKLLWNFNKNSSFLIQENAFENVVWEMAAILFRGRWDNLFLGICEELIEVQH